MKIETFPFTRYGTVSFVSSDAVNGRLAACFALPSDALVGLHQ